MTELEARIAAEIPRLRRYARALLRERAAADDLVQECLERALGRLRSWREGSELRPWLFTIMHNLFVDRLRRAGRAAPLLSLEETPEEALPAAHGGGPEEAVRLEQLEEAIAQLPAEQREVLLLVALEGLRYDQVAQVLALPEGTVMSRLSRARARLRTLLADSPAEPAPRLRRVK